MPVVRGDRPGVVSSYSSLNILCYVSEDQLECVPVHSERLLNEDQGGPQ